MHSDVAIIKNKVPITFNIVFIPRITSHQLLNSWWSTLHYHHYGYGLIFLWWKNFIPPILFFTTEVILFYSFYYCIVNDNFFNIKRKNLPFEIICNHKSKMGLILIFYNSPILSTRNPGGSDSKEFACNVGDRGSIPA